MIYYVALPFVRVEGGLAPGEAVEYPHAPAAIRRAPALKRWEDQAVGKRLSHARLLSATLTP